jgi:hypothetical protein
MVSIKFSLRDVIAILFGIILLWVEWLLVFRDISHTSAVIVLLLYSLPAVIVTLTALITVSKRLWISLAVLLPLALPVVEVAACGRIVPLPRTWPLYITWQPFIANGCGFLSFIGVLFLKRRGAHGPTFWASRYVGLAWGPILLLLMGYWYYYAMPRPCDLREIDRIQVTPSITAYVLYSESRLGGPFHYRYLQIILSDAAGFRYTLASEGKFLGSLARGSSGYEVFSDRRGVVATIARSKRSPYRFRALCLP